MKTPPADAGPLADDEIVYRLIHRDFGGAAEESPVGRQAFKPTARDTDGLSVFRAAIISPRQVLAAIPDTDKREKYSVAALPVAAFTALGLTVIPTPHLSVVPGHASVPEMNGPAYVKAPAGNKEQCMEWQLALAVIAGENIVIRATA